MNPADIRARIERAKQCNSNDEPLELSVLVGELAADCEALLTSRNLDAAATAGLRAKSNLYRGSSDVYRSEVNDLRFQMQRLSKERERIEQERDKYRHQAAAYADALTQQTIGLTDALGQTFSDPEQLYSMVRKLTTDRDDYQAQRDAMRANLEHQKAKRLGATNESDRLWLLVSDLMALFCVSILHPQAELQLRRRAADAKKGAESWIHDQGEIPDWTEPDQVRKPSYADSGRGANEP